jgi:hypothetical protein
VLWRVERRRTRRGVDLLCAGRFDASLFAVAPFGGGRSDARCFVGHKSGMLVRHRFAALEMTGAALQQQPVSVLSLQRAAVPAVRDDHPLDDDRLPRGGLLHADHPCADHRRGGL